MWVKFKLVSDAMDILNESGHKYEFVIYCLGDFDTSSLNKGIRYKGFIQPENIRQTFEFFNIGLLSLENNSFTILCLL